MNLNSFVILRVHLNLNKCENWVHKEANLFFILSSDKYQRKFAFMFALAKCNESLDTMISYTVKRVRNIFQIKNSQIMLKYKLCRNKQKITRQR